VGCLLYGEALQKKTNVILPPKEERSHSLSSFSSPSHETLHGWLSSKSQPSKEKKADGFCGVSELSWLTETQELTAGKKRVRL